LAEWVGAKSKSRFVFPRDVRPVPLEIRIQVMCGEMHRERERERKKKKKRGRKMYERFIC